MIPVVISGWSARCRRRCALTLTALWFVASALAPEAAPIPLGPASADAATAPAGSLPSPRSRTSAVWADGSAYIFGGKVVAPDGGLQRTGYEGSREIVKFTPGSPSRVVALLPPVPGYPPGSDGRRDTAAIWTGQYVYVFGGYDDCGVPLDDIVRFDPATNGIDVVNDIDDLDLGTGGATAIWAGTSAYIFGGYVQSGTRGCQGDQPVISDQIVRYSPGNGAQTLAETLPSPRNHAAAVFADPNIYLYGGHNGRDALNEIVELTPFPEAPPDVSIVGRLPSPRHDASAIWLPGTPFPTGSAYVFGGALSSRDEAATNEIVAHDPLTAPGVRVVDRLYPNLPPPLDGGRAHMSAVASSSVGGYLFGGESGPNGRDLSAEILSFIRPVRYAALGDSYSSGEGLADDDGPYLGGGDPRCNRHELAYPVQFQFNGPTQLDFFACSGARTEHIYRDQQRSAEVPGSNTPQALRPAVNDRTDLVTMTIGGNDIGKPDEEGSGGLGQVLGYCYRKRDCHKDKDFVARIRSKTASLASKLRSSIVAIKQRTGPDTAIFLLGYPRVFPTDANPRQQAEERDCDAFDGTALSVDGWTPKEQTYLNRATDRLNALTASVAAAGGVRFVDVTERFTGHAICDREGEPWIEKLNTNTPLPPFGANQRTSSFHPNKAGHDAYAQALEGDIGLVASNIVQGITPGRLTPIGLPANPAPLNAPLVRLNRVKTVRLGRRSRFSGTIRDDFGIDRATLSFGDGSRRKVPIQASGAFKLTHRYRKAGRYRASLSVVGKEGAKAKVQRKLRVRPRRGR